jgi:hypothetical protein
MRLLFLLMLVTLGALNTLSAQGLNRWSLGLHGGADVSDDHTLKLLGAHLGYGIATGTRIQLAVTSVIEEPGTTVFGGLTAQWSPTRWTLRPFVGGGLGMGYSEAGPFSDTELGGMVQGGFRFFLRNLTPFAELRLFSFDGTRTQILIGFESRAY